MANTGFFKGWLGRFKLVRRYTPRNPGPGGDELGRLYAAYNVLKYNPALVQQVRGAVRQRVLHLPSDAAVLRS